MDFWGTVVVLFRRWYISLPAFLATLVLAGAAYMVVPLQFESGEVLVLTTPLNGGTEYKGPDHTDSVTNPMMNFDQSLALTASLVIQQLRSTETSEALGVRPGDTTTYEVNNGSSNPELLQSGPFIFVRGPDRVPVPRRTWRPGWPPRRRRSSRRARRRSTPRPQPTSRCGSSWHRRPVSR